MESGHTFTLTDQPTQEDRRVIDDGLTDFNIAHAGPDGYRPLCIFIRDAQGQIIGGLTGETYWGWLHVDLLWLPEGIRRQGYGKRIMQMAEEEARKRGCNNAHLDTMSFQALDFYVKLGYSLWGQLDDLPEGHTRYFLKKSLR